MTRAALLRGSVALLLAPLDWMVLGALVATALAGRAWRFFAPAIPPSFAPCQPECTIVVVSWHGRDALARSLPPLCEAVRHHGGGHEIVVIVDHAGIDGTSEWLAAQFPRVKALRAERNLDYGKSVRRGIEAAARDVVVLVDNDALVERDFLAGLLAPLANPLVFGVASSVVASPGAGPETGRTRACVAGADIVWSHEPLAPSEDPQPVSWLHRGAVAIDRRKYRWLKGFDALFDPFFFEDADLAHRAWKAGWSCVVAPSSRIARDHGGEPGTGPERDEFLAAIALRNAHTFFWKNIDDVPLLAAHCLAAAGRRLRRSRAGIRAKVELAGYFAALDRLPVILRRKIDVVRRARRGDREVFRLAGD